MTLTDQLTDYVHATFTGIWVRTGEPDEAEREIVRLGRPKGWTIAAWDLAGGLRLLSPADQPAPEGGAGDPLAALRALAVRTIAATRAAGQL